MSFLASDYLKKSCYFRAASDKLGRTASLNSPSMNFVTFDCWLLGGKPAAAAAESCSFETCCWRKRFGCN